MYIFQGLFGSKILTIACLLRVSVLLKLKKLKYTLKLSNRNYSDSNILIYIFFTKYKSPQYKIMDIKILKIIELSTKIKPNEMSVSNQKVNI